MMNDILELLQAAYMDNSWIRIAARVGLILGGMLLLWFSGGFPPWAWRFLFQVIPQVPRLWAANGLQMIMPLAGLILLSATLLVAWGAFILVSIRMIRSWIQQRQELQRFNEEVLEADSLSEALSKLPQIPNSSAFPRRPVLAKAAPSAIANNNAALAAPSVTYQRSVPRRHYGVEDAVPAQSPIMVKNRVEAKHDARTESEPRMAAHQRNAVAESRPHSNGTTRSKRDIYLDIGTGLDAGIKRRGSPNEDSLFAIENITSSEMAPRPMGLFIVADGMGGHSNGSEASQLAIRAMRESVLAALRSEVKDIETIKELLIEGVQHANRSVYKRNQQQSADMGTTMTAALVWGGTVYVANVGDSRTYLYRGSEGLYQVTQDHSVVARLVELGAISPDEVYTHPKRNEILRALGNEPTVEVDCFTLPLQAGDVLLLCSDGVWEMARDHEIQEIVRTCAPYAPRICAMLIQAALNRGGQDNISVIAVCVREP
jgi:serine/threonine protein phosphatase PrpC